VHIIGFIKRNFKMTGLTELIKLFDVQLESK